MQLKLELPGIELDEPHQQLWSKLDPRAQRAVIQALAKSMTQALVQRAGWEEASEEGADHGEQ